MFSKRFALRILAVGVLALTQASSCADVKLISIGMNLEGCPTCANNLDRILKRLPGVKTTRLRIGRQTRLEVELKPRTWVDPQRMLEQIRHGGFDPRADDVLLTLSGTLQMVPAVHRAGLCDAASDVPVVVLVAAVPSNSRDRRTAAASADVARLDGHSVQVTGYWQPASNGEPARLLYSELCPVQLPSQGR